MSQQVSAYPLRMPSDLRAWLVCEANVNGRSLNNEIVQKLKECREKEKKNVVP